MSSYLGEQNIASEPDEGEILLARDGRRCKELVLDLCSISNQEFTDTEGLCTTTDSACWTPDVDPCSRHNWTFSGSDAGNSYVCPGCW